VRFCPRRPVSLVDDRGAPGQPYFGCVAQGIEIFCVELLALDHTVSSI
jgi:hypothetical protein